MFDASLKIMKTITALILLALSIHSQAEPTNSVTWQPDTNVVHVGYNPAGWPVVWWHGQSNRYELQQSTNLIKWTTIWTVQAPTNECETFIRSLGNPQNLKTNKPSYYRLKML